MLLGTALATATVLMVSVPASTAGALDEVAAWGVVPSPNKGDLENELAGLTIAGVDDIWAVGRYNSGRPPTVTGRDTLALHWDGTTWIIVSTPNPTWPGADYFTLEDSVAVAPHRVWAVGFAQDFSSLRSTTLAELWDGARWRSVPTPNPGGESLPNVLNAVDSASPTAIWAVGGFGFPERGLILRWNGSRWRAVRNPCRVELLGVDVVTASDVWAVGSSRICHFDGTRWERVPSPRPDGEAYILQAVSGTWPDDAWAAGYRVFQDGEHVSAAPLVEHWNGSGWTLVAGFVPGETLNGVLALGPDDVWIVGTDGTRGTVGHWDGTDWVLVPSPSLGDSGSLADVEAESADHLWAVGTSLGQTLVLEAPSRFEGTVVGDTNVSFMTVSWFGPESGSTETNFLGEYAAAGLTAGTYQFIATEPGCSPDSAEVVVVAGETVTQDLMVDC